MRSVTWGAALALSAALTAPTQASASEWWYVSETKDQIILVDAASITDGRHPFQGAVRQAWLATYGLEKDNPKWASRKSLWYVQCAGRMMAAKSFVDYDINGNVLATDTRQDFAMDFTPVVPGSIGEADMVFVCNAYPGLGALKEWDLEGGRHYVKVDIGQVERYFASLRASSVQGGGQSTSPSTTSRAPPATVGRRTIPMN